MLKHLALALRQLTPGAMQASTEPSVSAEDGLVSLRTSTVSRSNKLSKCVEAEGSR